MSATLKAFAATLFAGVAGVAALCIHRRSEAKKRRVLVVGSINVDLYQRTKASSVTFAGKPIDITAVKGMTLPAASFVNNAKIAAQGVSAEAGKEEALVLTMDGPFTQKTGGKGANSAAAAGQTFACEFFGNMGAASAEENKALLADLAAFGGVDTSRSSLLPDCPTGTAYILLFDDNDNAILLLGGANQTWPPPAEVEASTALSEAISGSVALMMQREVPEYVNVAAAKLASSMGVPVFMDVGGTDAPLDPNLMPYITMISPNESELTFLTGVSTEAGGKVSKPLVRKAVHALKAKFGAAGNGAVQVLVTLGSEGSVHFGGAWDSSEGELASTGALAHETHMGTFALKTPDGKPLDTTGAGDCFRGSFVGAYYGDGKSLEEAMRWAAAAGTLSVQVEGAMPSMPPRDKIEAQCAEPLVPP